MAGGSGRIGHIWSSYIHGQLANVGRAAVWWSTFSVLTMKLLDSELALACARGAFNLALLVGAPVAVATAEKTAIRSLLIRTSTGRALLWSVAVPCAWVVAGNWQHWSGALWGAVLTVMFLDGVAVAFANAVDIDCGGLDLLSLSYSLPITDYVRYRYTALHQEFFDSSFVFLTPPLLLALAFLSSKVDITLYLPPQIVGPDSPTFILVLGVALIFAVLTLISLHFYRRIPRLPANKNLYDPPSQQRTAVPLNSAGSAAWPMNGPDTPAHREASTRVYGKKFGEVLDGWLIVFHDPPLKWRLIALATETALEDVMVSVIIPIIALNGTPIATKSTDVTVAAFVCAALIGVGKLGGFTTSRWLSGRLSGGTSQKLCNLVLASSLSLVCLPVGFWLLGQAELFGYAVPYYAGPAVIAVGICLFFVLSTAPKIGFASLIQSAVGTDDSEAAVVFGFIGIFVTVTDGLLIIAISLIMYLLGPPRTELALCIVFLAYLAHGIIESKFASRLEPPPAEADSPTGAGNLHHHGGVVLSSRA